MASVSWQGFTGFLGACVAGVQAAANAIIDATVGSVTLALSQSLTGVALFLQGQAVQVAALTRFATSYGPDADSFGADFYFGRLGATYATTTETFARFTATNPALIPAGTGANATLTGGAAVSTGPGGVQFMVTIDETNELWNAEQGGYLLPANTSSAIVPIQCLSPGTVGNVLADTITSFFAPIVGIDSCSNTSDVTNGLNAESDPAYKTRFPVYLAGLASADNDAIINAIQGVQQGIQYLPVENYDYPGTNADNGNFFIVIDDGSHDPPDSLVTAVYNAVNAIRGFTIRFQVYGVTSLAVNLTGTITSGAGYVHGSVVEAVDSAWANWINTLWEAWLKTVVPGLPLPPLVVAVAEAAAVALSVPGCTNIELSSIQINGENADLVLSVVETPVPGTISAA